MKTLKLFLTVLFLLVSAAPSWAGWGIIDDYEGETLGLIHGQTAANGQVWNIDSGTQPYLEVAVEDSSQVFESLPSTPKYGFGQLPLATTIAEGTTATLYYRIKLIDATADAATAYIIGGYDGTDTGHYSKTAVIAFVNNNDGTGCAFAYSTVAGDELAIQLGQWYEAWIYINLTDADPDNYYFEAYIDGPGLSGQTLLTSNGGADTYQLLRNYTPGQGIVAFSFYKSSATVPAQGFFMDDAYIDLNGKNLTSAYNWLALAHDPTPADGAEDVPQNTTLSWYTGLADINDPNSWATSGITHHHVYMSNGDPDDPNVYYKTTIAAGAQTGSWPPPTMPLDSVYSWRVDEGFNSNPGDPGVLTGQLWTFDVVHSVPTIVEQPERVVADVGSNPQFHVGAINPLTGDTTGLSYKWYNATTGLPLNDGAEFSNTTTDTLTVLDAQVGDDMYLFCRVTMVTGSSDTDTVTLGVKDRLTYWTFDAAQYSGAAHADEEGYQAAIPHVTGTATFTTGADGTADGALIVDADNWCTAGSFVPEEYTGEMSLSLWVNWNGPGEPAATQYMISKRKADGSSHFHCGGLSSTSGAFKIRTSLTGDYTVTPGLTAGAWNHVVFTVANYDGGAKRVRIYLNGLGELDATTFLFGNFPDAVITIGSLDDAGVYPLNGAVDDVAIYNYALTPTEVATLYSSINGPYCLEYPPFDYDQSCVVDLADFAIFAAQWLDCNIFPTCITTVP
ncbi:MAG: LamG domain-containing protein [Sedimentisphaerales bacterium]|nr:LamG domain-containing protein [Sedimentisphaerales bacterium]